MNDQDLSAEEKKVKSILSLASKDITALQKVIEKLPNDRGYNPTLTPKGTRLEPTTKSQRIAGIDSQIYQREQAAFAEINDVIKDSSPEIKARVNQQVIDWKDPAKSFERFLAESKPDISDSQTAMLELKTRNQQKQASEFIKKDLATKKEKEASKPKSFSMSRQFSQTLKNPDYTAVEKSQDKGVAQTGKKLNNPSMSLSFSSNLKYSKTEKGDTKDNDQNKNVKNEKKEDKGGNEKSFSLSKQFSENSQMTKNSTSPKTESKEKSNPADKDKD